MRHGAFIFDDETYKNKISDKCLIVILDKCGINDVTEWENQLR